MWITRKQMDKIIEREVERVERKYQSEILDKELEISRLKNQIAMKDIKHAIMDLELKITDWSTHWGLNITESEE